MSTMDVRFLLLCSLLYDVVESCWIIMADFMLFPFVSSAATVHNESVADFFAVQARNNRVGLLTRRLMRPSALPLVFSLLDGWSRSKSEGGLGFDLCVHWRRADGRCSAF